MKRLSAPGFQVDACSAAPTVPPVTGTWYQRTADWLAELPCTVCESHSDSTPLMLVYWFCIISRIGRGSRSLPPCDGTASGGLAHVLPVIESVGPVKVEFAVLFQST